MQNTPVNPRGLPTRPEASIEAGQKGASQGFGKSLWCSGKWQWGMGAPFFRLNRFKFNIDHPLTHTGCLDAVFG